MARNRSIKRIINILLNKNVEETEEKKKKTIKSFKILLTRLKNLIYCRHKQRKNIFLKSLINEIHRGEAKSFKKWKNVKGGMVQRKLK